jgi:hypothetical protein
MNQINERWAYMQEKLLQLQREIYLSETAEIDSQEKRDFYVGYSAMLYFFLWVIFLAFHFTEGVMMTSPI